LPWLIALRAMVKEAKSSMFVLVSTTFWLLKSLIYHFSPFSNTIFLYLSPYPMPHGQWLAFSLTKLWYQDQESSTLIWNETLATKIVFFSTSTHYARSPHYPHPYYFYWNKAITFPYQWWLQVTTYKALEYNEKSWDREQDVATLAKQKVGEMI
jgi:hypothetical protein